MKRLRVVYEMTYEGSESEDVLREVVKVAATVAEDHLSNEVWSRLDGEGRIVLASVENIVASEIPPTLRAVP